MSSDRVVGTAAQIFELQEPWILLSSHDEGHFLGEHERSSFSLDTEFALEMAKEVTKIDVEQITSICQHDVIRVSVSNSQNISCHTISSTRSDEIFSGNF